MQGLLYLIPCNARAERGVGVCCASPGNGHHARLHTARHHVCRYWQGYCCHTGVQASTCMRDGAVRCSATSTKWAAVYCCSSTALAHCSWLALMCALGAALHEVINPQQQQVHHGNMMVLLSFQVSRHSLTERIGLSCWLRLQA